MVTILLFIILNFAQANTTWNQSHESPDWNWVYSDEEIDQCKRFRTPNMIMTQSESGKNPTFHLIARCCGQNLCSSKGLSGDSLGDDDSDAVVVMKTSSDLGATWSNFQQLSPLGETSYTNGSAIYDALRKQIVVQYVYIPGGSTAPSKNVRYFQITSKDDAKSWSEPKEITDQLSKCSKSSDNMMVPSAGSKVQSDNGRLLWPGHDHAGNGVVWYSDDGGETHGCTHRFTANEISISNASSDHHPNRLYMNGRGGEFMPNRSQYWSEDNGSTWQGPEKSLLLDDDNSGCERSLKWNNGATYSCEPQGHDRKNMVCQCSHDGGNHWNHSSGSIDGDSQSGYSAIEVFDKGMLVVMEDKTTENMKAAVISTSWCTDSSITYN